MDIVNKETFKAKLQKLVDHFSDNEKYYKSNDYKEDHLRQEFINPFFKALGWDMDNEQGFAPQYREVIHEDRIEIEGKPKAPDYAFKVGSDRKFFVEAKASSVKVFSEIDPAFQLRRYAWSGQLPISLLTDFEEFSIYDTTIEPKHTDKSSVARIKYIYYTDYLKEVDYLWDTFSKEAVWKGSFDKFAKKEKKGSQLVDKSFLKEIESWRDLLAKDIANNNRLNIYELNSVVQKFIDRIIFLRIAEDRGVETYETLRGAVKAPDTYSQLLKIFKRADEKYNSSLFDLKKDELSTQIKVSDKTLNRILNNLYYPKSPYEFSVIGVDILGSVYEQFLGKVIRLTKSGNAVIEEKPEVKKAGGVYYTPQYIVDYIEKNTVGELVKGKTPKDVAKLKIVDPACGSGSFLIGAYNYLLNWHHKYYIENDVEKNLKTKKLFKDGEGNYFLSTQEKKDILLNNIHGVDIDPQAVEVTKLSLALKMLEGENSETINAQYKLFADRILPDLSSNIKCGNSLIGSDYYSDKQITLLGDEEIRKVNAFDWDKEFPLVFRYGGFDAVIGNPPYGAELTNEEEKYICNKYESNEYQNNTFVTFIEKSFGIVKKSGYISFIIPAVLLAQHYFSKIRGLICKESLIIQMLMLNYKVFQNADTGDTLIFVLEKQPYLGKSYGFKAKIVKDDNLEESAWNKISIEDIIKNQRNEILINHTPLMKKLFSNKKLLGDIAHATVGIKPYQKGKGVPSQTKEVVEKRPFDSNLPSDSRYKEYIIGRDIHKYFILPIQRKYILYGDWLAEPRKSISFEERKVVMRQTADCIIASIDENRRYNLNNVYNLVSIDSSYSLELLLGLLNSKLFIYIYQHLVQERNRVFAEIKKINLSKLPMVNVSQENIELVKSLEKLVQEILRIEGTDNKKYSILDQNINNLVYRLYELDSSEIKEIENYCREG